MCLAGALPATLIAALLAVAYLVLFLLIYFFTHRFLNALKDEYGIRTENLFSVRENTFFNFASFMYLSADFNNSFVYLLRAIRIQQVICLSIYLSINYLEFELFTVFLKL